MNRFILPFLLLTAFSFNAFSSHWAGADLTYRCLGGNDYEITFTFYRDCSGISAPATVNIPFNCSSNASLGFSISMPRITNTGQDITPICDSVVTRCNALAPAPFGVQEYIYRAQVTLPPCNYWTMSYSLCCRNPNNTIQSPTSQIGFIKATLNNQQAPCLSSPEFVNKPVNVICVGHTYCIDFAAITLGDSLSYELTPVLHNATTPLTYLAGYSYLQPLPSQPPLNCNPITGEVCMTPQMGIVTVMAVLVKQWRTINGVPTVVGTIMRDLQLIVDNCNNNIPLLSGIDTTLTKGYDPSDTTYQMMACPGVLINFNIYGHDADTNNPGIQGNPETFRIDWDSGIPAGIFTSYHNNTDSAYANFQWTPSFADVGHTPRCFKASIRDNACPYYSIRFYKYCFLVNQLQVDLGNDTLVCKGDIITITANADINAQVFDWKIDNLPVYQNPVPANTLEINTANYAPGIYYISVEALGHPGPGMSLCSGYSSMSLEIVSAQSPGQITGPVTTPPHSEVYYATTLNPPGQKSWTVLGGAILNSQSADSALVRWFPMQTGKVMLRFEDINACVSKDTLSILIGTDGIDDIKTSHIKVYPNPASEKIYFEAGDESYRGFTIEIIDVQGRIKGVYSTASSRLEVDISSLPQGLYFYRMKNLNGEHITGGSFSLEK
jgi:hypothetical protein